MDRKWIAVGAAVVVVGVVAAVLLTGGGDDDGGSSNEVPIAETVAAENNEYGPDTFTVVEGEYVRFVNNDDVTHTFTADEGLFDSGPVDPGNDYRYAFDGPVTVSFHCEIHPSMTGTVEVTAS
jgi:plastocyanin